MSIIEVFLNRNCTPEQSTMLSECFRTIREMGLVEIDYNLDELFQRIEHLETYDIIQQCYAMVAKLQHLAFDAMQLDVAVEDIAVSNSLLNYINMIEQSENSTLIAEIIDDAETPHDAFLTLLDRICYTSLHDIEPIIVNVPTEFIERIYEVHHSNLLDNMQVDSPVKEIDSRILEILKSIWSAREFRPVKTYILENELNLPLPEEVVKDQFGDYMRDISTSMDKKFVARGLLELALVLDVEYKDIKDKMKHLSKQFYGNNLLFASELAYHIDNVCMEFKINGSY